MILGNREVRFLPINSNRIEIDSHISLVLAATVGHRKGSSMYTDSTFGCQEATLKLDRQIETAKRRLDYLKALRNGLNQDAQDSGLGQNKFVWQRQEDGSLLGSLSN